MNKRYTSIIQNKLLVEPFQIEKVELLISEGNTIPFIARYRKEQTGDLDEVQIFNIHQMIEAFKDLDQRKDFVLKSVEEQGKLNVSLKGQILNTTDVKTLEDLYLPYKKRKKTKADIAIENGLEGLAKIIMKQHQEDIKYAAKRFLTNEVRSIEEAIDGAKYIISDWIFNDIDIKNRLRNLFERRAIIQSKLVKGKEHEAEKYKDYFAYSEPVYKAPSHRVLALLRGESEKFLNVKFRPDGDEAILILSRRYLRRNSACPDVVENILDYAYKKQLLPSLENECKKYYKEKADLTAIDVFANNLEQKLLEAPAGEKVCLAIDPAYRTGCKWVVLTANGQFINEGKIFPFDKEEDAFRQMEQVLNRDGVEIIAVGNGTAGRETYQWFKKRFDFKDIFLVDESGASIYSASEIAREEFPDLDLTLRGAISIGRRLIDPLAELIKIDPKSIGVGQYQHDVNQKLLKEKLDLIIEVCVNKVGVNLNTASKSLLSKVSGIGPSIAENIVQYRNNNGAFKSRNELKKVPKLGEKAFKQCAGFLRIHQAKNVLDRTAIHPESYSIASKIMKDLNLEIGDQSFKKTSIDNSQYQTDAFTLKDILNELAQPGQDPRSIKDVMEFANIHSIQDLNIGQVLPGIVSNITNFGAFVDLGIKEKALLHISEIANEFIKDPNEKLSLNQQLEVKVIDIDVKRSRIAVSLKQL